MSTASTGRVVLGVLAPFLVLGMVYSGARLMELHRVRQEEKLLDACDQALAQEGFERYSVSALDINRVCGLIFRGAPPPQTPLVFVCIDAWELTINKGLGRAPRQAAFDTCEWLFPPPSE